MFLKGTQKYIYTLSLAAAYARKRRYNRLSYLLIGAIFLSFFIRRDFSREITETEGYLAACDGHVDVIEPYHEDENRLNISTYMHGYNQHVIRSPFSGTISGVEHIPGAHKLAFTGKSRGGNEQLRIKYESGLEVHLIAGAFMRRTISYYSVGDTVEKGERLGHIALSSRVRVIMPESVDRNSLTVEEGKKMLASQTVLCPDPDQQGNNRSTN